MNEKVLLQAIGSKQFKPVYLLHGEEAYYIDLITKALVENVLQEEERDFNQSVYYGKDSEALAIVSDAKSYPMMAERRLVIIKEAQELKDIDKLEAYCAKPSETTVLVICYKYKKFDSRLKTYKAIAKTGEVFHSEKVKEYQLADWISKYLQSSNYSITPKASTLLADSLGNDLLKITNELDKLFILLKEGTSINEVHIEENIGISKDYNVFELTNAIAVRDITKAYSIISYFEHNPKSASLIQIVSSIFPFFIRLMRIHFLPNKSGDAIATALKVHPFVARELLQASKIYTPKKIAANVNILYEYDLKSKGINNSTFTEGELMRELIYKMMH